MNNKKFALVTGSSKGIGKATALALAKDGFNIFIHYHSEVDQAKQVVEQIKSIGREAYSVTGDVSSEEEMQQAFKQVSEVTDRLDLLVNNAAMDYLYDIESYPIDKMKRVVEVDLVGVFIVTKLALPFLKKSPRGHIINVASRLGQEKTVPKAAAYSAAKAGVIKFTKCCALEFRQYKIRANAVLPGLTDTPLTRNLYPDETFWQNAATANPSGRVGKPEDIANVVAFLASPKAEYINGETIGVNGGSNLV